MQLSLYNQVFAGNDLPEQATVEPVVLLLAAKIAAVMVLATVAIILRKKILNTTITLYKENRKYFSVVEKI